MELFKKRIHRPRGEVGQGQNLGQCIRLNTTRQGYTEDAGGELGGILGEHIVSKAKTLVLGNTLIVF
jgi:hypothetical protein